MPDDRELWGRIVTGDAPSFDGFYRENAPRLQGFVRQIVGDPQAAEDIAQETFVQIWNRPNGFQPEPGQRQELQVVGLGTVEVQGDYLDHLPPLVYRPQETLDPDPREFRIVAPVLVRDNQVISKVDGSSIDTGSLDATLMLYVPSDGRYLVSIAPFEGAVEGNVHLGQIGFSLQGHDYLLLTSMPITISEHVWVKHEPEFKASEHMMRRSDRVTINRCS